MKKLMFFCVLYLAFLVPTGHTSLFEHGADVEAIGTKRTSPGRGPECAPETKSKVRTKMTATFNELAGLVAAAKDETTLPRVEMLAVTGPMGPGEAQTLKAFVEKEALVARLVVDGVVAQEDHRLLRGISAAFGDLQALKGFVRQNRHRDNLEAMALGVFADLVVFLSVPDETRRPSLSLKRNFKELLAHERSSCPVCTDTELAGTGPTGGAACDFLDAILALQRLRREAATSNVELVFK